MDSLKLQPQGKYFISSVRVLDKRSFDGVALQLFFDVGNYCDSLYSDLEIEPPFSLEKVSIKRKADFLAGRYAAKQAMQQLSIAYQNITIGDHRQPIWPHGVVGSISHTQEVAVCLLSKNTQQLIGVDVENILDTSVTKEISKSIISQEEANINPSVSGFDLFVTIAFSAKETLFKALFPQVGNYFGFDVAQVVSICAGSQVIYLRLKESLAEGCSKGREFAIRYEVIDGRVMSYLACKS